MTLLEAAKLTNTDRVWHQYCEVYQQLLGHLQHEPVQIMEQGILGGDGLEMWSKWLTHPLARITGLDIHDRGYRPTDSRIRVHICSNTDPSAMRKIYAQTGPLDWVCEDASHVTSNQIESWTLGWPFIRPGGFWVTEDCHSAHSPQHQDCHINFLQYCAKVAFEMQDNKGAEGCAAYDPLNSRADILSIEMRRGLVIFRKRA